MTKVISRALLTVLLLAVLLPVGTYAGPARSQEHQLVQPDGTIVRAVLQGDEFFHWFETPSGHPIVQDANEVWHYAEPGNLDRASKQIAGKRAPTFRKWQPTVPDEVLKKRREPRKRSVPLNRGRKATIDFLRSSQAPTDNTSLFTASTSTKSLSLSSQEPVSGMALLTETASATAAATGMTVGRMAVFLATFPDRVNRVFTSAAAFEEILFSTDSSKRSVRDMYEKMSFGAFTVNSGPGGITGPYVGTREHDYYGANKSGTKLGGNDEYPALLVAEVVRAAIAAGFDFGPYDTDNDGFVDTVAIIYQGNDEADSGTSNDIWAHQSSFSNQGFFGIHPIQTNSYNSNGQRVVVDTYFMASEKDARSTTTPKEPQTMGVFAHEYAHALGLPDLYDTDYSSSGLGGFSLMAGGSNNSIDRSGDCPAFLDAWSRNQLGWVVLNRLTVNHAEYEMEDAKEGNEAVYLWKNGQSNKEYFLVENRQKTGYDSDIPGSGLLIYHVDENVTTDNEKEWYKTAGTAANTGRGHYLVALEQADGQFHLERDKTNRGDIGDPYPGNYGTGSAVFDNDTTPNSKAYNVAPAVGFGEATFVAVRKMEAALLKGTITADFFINEDRDFPGVVIDAPANGTIYETITQITGTAYDASGVSYVRLILQENKPGGRWYNWVTDSFDSTTLNESIHGLDVTPSNGPWSTMVDQTLPDGAYTLQARGVDNKGATSEYVTSSFVVKFDSLSPGLTIDSPSESAALAFSPLVSGTATDNVGIREKRFAFFSFTLRKWYNWTAGSFDDVNFDFARHLFVISNGNTSWSLQMPTGLPQGSYYLAAQSLDTSDQASAWMNRSFSLAYKPVVTVTSLRQNVLLNAFPAITGTVIDKSGSGLVNDRIGLTIVRNGQYWNGATWQDNPFVLYAPVDGNGNWSFTDVPTGSGQIAVSAFATDNAGNTSEPMSGGSTNYNQVVFNLDMDPPTVSIDSPAIGATVTAASLPQDWITGFASDSQSKPTVGLSFRRTSDNLYWNGKRWDSENVQFAGVFAGTDRVGSIWDIRDRMPQPGLSSTYCLPNGSYELLATARDLAGNSATARVPITVGYNPTYPLTRLNPPQLDPPVPIGSVNFTELERVDMRAGPEDNRLQDPNFVRKDGAGNTYLGFTSNVTGVNNGRPLSYPYPVLQRVGAWRLPVPAEGDNSWLSLVAMDVDAAGNTYAAFDILTLQQFYMPVNGVNQYDDLPANGPTSLAMKVAPNGAVLWRKVLGSTTGYYSGTGSRSYIKGMQVAADGALSVLVDNSFAISFNEQTVAYGTQTVITRIASGGTVSFTKFFGYGGLSENEVYNSSADLFAVDSLGNSIFAAEEGLPGEYSQNIHVLRKFSPTGEMLAQIERSVCQDEGDWTALRTDADNNIYVGGSFVFGNGDSRMSLLKFDSGLNELWRALAPPATGGTVVALDVRPQGITLAGTAFGVNSGPNYWSVAKFTNDGSMVWARRETKGQVEKAVFDSAGDALMIGYVPDANGLNQRAYGKVSFEGDVQFVKPISQEYHYFKGELILLANDKAAVLTQDLVSREALVTQLDNPANMPEPAPVMVGSNLGIREFAGQNFTYQFRATNNPTHYTLTGTLPGGLSFNSELGQITGAATRGTPSAGVTVGVTATNRAGTSSPINAVIHISDDVTRYQTDVSVKSITHAPEPATIGGEVVYTVTLHNAGPDLAYGVIVLVTMSSHTSFVESSAYATFPAGGTSYYVYPREINELPSGEDRTFTFKVHVNSTAPAGGSVAQTVSVESESTDPNTSNNTGTRIASVVGVPEPSANLSLSVTHSPATVGVGGNITYTYKVQNAGPDRAESNSLRVIPDPKQSFVSSTAPSLASNGHYYLALPTLTSGSNSTISVVFRANEIGTINTVGEVFSMTADPVAGNEIARSSVVSLPTVGITAVDGTSAEPQGTGSPATGRFRFSRTGATGSSLTVKYQFVAGTGKAALGTDFTVTGSTIAGTAVIPAGTAYLDLTVVPKRDLLLEGTEVATALLTANSTYATSSAKTASIVVTDTLQTPYIYGRVLDDDNRGLGSVQVIRNTGTSPIYTNTLGEYCFMALPAGSYQFSAVLSGKVMYPQTLPFVVMTTTARRDVDFLALSGLHIAGRVQTDVDALTKPTYAGLASAVVNLSGSRMDQATTTRQGYYGFSSLTKGSYVVTPFASGYTFFSPKLAISLIDKSILNRDFLGLTGRYIQGQVFDGSFTPLPVVGVRARINSGTTTIAIVSTNSQGFFGKSNLPSATYSCTLALTGWDIFPSTSAANTTTASVKFPWAMGLKRPFIQGKVINAAGLPLPGIVVRGNTTPVRTNPSGYFGLSSLAAGNYLVKPEATGRVFSPLSRSATVSATTSSTNQDFKSN